MIDIIILVACTLCGYAVGKYIEKRFKRKGEFYNDLTRYARMLKANVQGRRVELPRFDEEFCTQCSQIFADFLHDGRIKCSLNSVQKANVSKFFENLSCASSDELSRHIDYYGEVLGSDAKQVNETEVAKASVYVKLGVLFGIMVGIVLM